MNDVPNYELKGLELTVEQLIFIIELYNQFIK